MTLKVIEFTFKGGPFMVADDPLSVNGVAIHREDGTPVTAGELSIGKVYTVRSDGLFMPPLSRKQRRAMK